MFVVACVAVLAVKLSYADDICVKSSKYIRGYGGRAFDDKEVAKHGDITAIEVRCEKYFSGIKIRYGKTFSEQHGECNNNYPEDAWRRYTLSPGESIVDVVVEVDSSRWLTNIIFKTNLRTLPKCGYLPGDYRKQLEGKRLKYISGRAGCMMDGLQFHWHKF